MRVGPWIATVSSSTPSPGPPLLLCPRCVCALVNSTYSFEPRDALAAANDTSAIKVAFTSVDHTRGTFRFDRASNQAILHYPAGGNADIAANCTCIVHKLADQSGLPIDGIVYEPDTTWAHCLGGATLGTACDSYGRVRGCKNLYVNDGAMLPGSAGASNPSLTITAVAERNIATVVSEGG